MQFGAYTGHMSQFVKETRCAIQFLLSDKVISKLWECIAVFMRMTTRTSHSRCLQFRTSVNIHLPMDCKYLNPKSIWSSEPKLSKDNPVWNRVVEYKGRKVLWRAVYQVLPIIEFILINMRNFQTLRGCTLFASTYIIASANSFEIRNANNFLFNSIIYHLNMF